MNRNTTNGITGSPTGTRLYKESTSPVNLSASGFSGTCSGSVGTDESGLLQAGYGASAGPVPAPSVAVVSPGSGSVIQAGGDVTATVKADLSVNGNASNALSSLLLKVQGGTGGGGGDLTPDADGYASLDLGTLAAGTYTLTAVAMYDNGDAPLEVDSQPVTFTVASFTVKTGSWNPNPAYVGQIISGQVQAKFDPASVDGGGSGQTFVVYTWSTVGVWYSQDGTAGTFEPYGGDGIVEWQQGTADTTFQAQFFAPGQYLLEVVCTASVYGQATGGLVGTFTGTGYIGGSASDIDTSGGGGTGHARAARERVAHAGGGGDGITVIIQPVTVTFNPNSLVKLGLGAPTSYWKEVTATVTPASQAKNFTFSASNGEISVLSNASNANSTTGVVTLTVLAVSETPASTMGVSDCNVEALYNGSTLPAATVPILVIQPTRSVETPASSNEKSVTNLCVYADTNPKGLKGWNIAIPPPNSKNVYFATQCLLPITIKILDQFGNKLDSMYDGYHLVNETVTGNTTINDQPIDNPDGKFSNGQIVDNVALSAYQPDDPSDEQFNYLVDHWPGFNALFNGTSGAGGGTWDNAIALTYKNTTLLDHQTLSINGMSFPGQWDRKIIIAQKDHIFHPQDSQPHGVIMSVTETYIAPPGQ